MSSGFRSYATALLSLAYVAFLAVYQPLSAQEQPPSEIDYLLLASNKTSTMQDEMQEAAEAGYAFADVMGGETSFGGSEVVVMMQRLANSTPRFAYRLLATTRTSTMEKELQEAADDGFSYRGQTIFSTTFGGDEAVVILERDKDLVNPTRFEYRVLATKRTSTMQEELREAGAVGFQYVGLTVASTAFGGDEIVVILRRPVTDSESDSE